jgi:hypothetical protein
MSNINTAALALIIALVMVAWAWPAAAQTNQPRPRVVITADPELDDNNSLLRFLLYSTDVEVAGLIYASSQFHWKGDGKGTRWYVPGREYTRFGLKICPCESWRWAEDERFIHEAVEAYEQAWPNLRLHHADYPEPALLKSKIRYGNIEFDGDISKDSPGSDLIKSLLLDNEPGPLFITAWGGQSTIARALKSIQEQFEFSPEWPGIRAMVTKKLVLLPSGDQDDTYATYIKPNWPGIDYRQFTGGPNYSYGAQLKAKLQDSIYLSPDWMEENVTGVGPLGALYRVWGDGRQMVEGDIFDYFGLSGYANEELKQMGYIVWMPVQAKGSWLGEGDTGTFMGMLANGLRAWESGNYGGWGGLSNDRVLKFSLDDSTAADTTLDAMMSAISAATARTSSENAFPDFFPAAQRDFAARLKWSVTPRYEDANHEPRVAVEGPLDFSALPGAEVPLRGLVSDPDGDELSVRWWQFPVGSYPGELVIENPASAKTTVVIPVDAQPGQTIHLVLEATDKGTPALTRYQRMIITVRGH